MTTLPSFKETDEIQAAISDIIILSKALYFVSILLENRHICILLLKRVQDIMADQYSCFNTQEKKKKKKKTIKNIFCERIVGATRNFTLSSREKKL